MAKIQKNICLVIFLIIFDGFWRSEAQNYDAGLARRSKKSSFLRGQNRER